MFDFKPEPVEELVKGGYIPIRWIWKPYIAEESLTILAAFMKVGKTTMIYSLLKSITEGADFIGYPTRKSRVLLLALEEHRREVINRLVTMGVKENLHVHSAPLLPTVKSYSEIKMFIKNMGIKLLVIDTLSKLWNIEDENDNAEVIKAVTPLLELSRSSGAAVLLIHHSGKGDSVGGRAIRGASALFGAVDQGLILKAPTEGSSLRTLEATGRYSDTPSKISFEMHEDFTFHKHGKPTAKPGPKKLSQETLLECLLNALGSSQSPSTAESLLQTLGWGKTTLYALLEPLPPSVHRIGQGVKGDPFLYSLNGSESGAE